MFVVYICMSRVARLPAVRTSCLRYSSFPDFNDDQPESGRFTRRRGSRPYQPNVGLRHALEMLKQDEDGNIKPEKQGSEFKDLEFNQEEFEDLIQNSGQTYDDLERERFKQYRRRVFLRVKREFFPVPQERNLLTYAAKEQLRFLHETDPETWTPSKLHQSFPISEDGVRKLLKSKFRPESDEAIVEHDRAVLRNWKKLNKSQGPIATSVGQQLTSGKLDFESLDGNRRLPMPTSEWKNQRSSLVQSGTRRNGTAIALPVGEFGDILRKYEAAATAVRAKSNGKIDKNLKVTSVKSICEPELDSTDFGYMSPTGVSDARAIRQQHQVSIDEFKETMRKNVHKFKKSKPIIYEKFKEYLDGNSEKSSISKPQAQQSKASHYDEFESDGIIDYLNGDLRKYNEESDECKHGLRWDAPRTATDARHQEAYVYHPRTGYQRPYGRFDHTDRIEISESIRVAGAVWKKGDCYYDENGELLYRIPFTNGGEKLPPK